MMGATVHSWQNCHFLCLAVILGNQSAIFAAGLGWGCTIGRRVDINCRVFRLAVRGELMTRWGEKGVGRWDMWGFVCGEIMPAPRLNGERTSLLESPGLGRRKHKLPKP